MENSGEIGKVYGFALNYGGFTAGSFVRLGNGASAAPFRAYLKYNGTLNDAEEASARRSAAALPGILGIEWVDGETTGGRDVLEEIYSHQSGHHGLLRFFLFRPYTSPKT